jgi:hypothetical protein
MPNTANNTVDAIMVLAGDIVPQIEASWACIIEVDTEIMQEAWARANLTLGHVELDQPNEIKQAAHYAFWIRKLKPLRVLNLSELAATTNELAALGMIRGHVDGMQETMPQGRRLYVNETFALLAAIGIVRHSGYGIGLSHEKKFNDLAISLRYHSFSPSALTGMLMAYVQNP